MISNNTVPFKPRDYANFNLTFSEVDALIDKIELIKRRKIKDYNSHINYIDPLNHVKTLKNPVNHLIIGRRGSGKTSLLIKVIEEIKKSDALVTVVDMQGKQRQSADLPLIEVLLNLFNDLKIALESSSDWEPYLSRKSKIKYYKLKSLYFGLISKDIWSNKMIEYDKLFKYIELIIDKLELIRATPNGAGISIVKSKTRKGQSSLSSKIFGSISADSKYLDIIKVSATVESNYTVVAEQENSTEEKLEFSEVYSKKATLDDLKEEIIKCIEYFIN